MHVAKDACAVAACLFAAAAIAMMKHTAKMEQDMGHLDGNDARHLASQAHYANHQVICSNTQGIIRILLTTSIAPPVPCPLQHVLSFQLPPAAAGAHVTALYRLTEGSGSAAGAQGGSGPRATGVGAPAVWSKQVYAAVQEQLRK